MRNVALILTLLTQPLLGQNKPRLSGSLENFYGSYLYIDTPYKNGAIEANQIKLDIDEEARFSESIELKESGFVGMFDSGTNVYLRFWLEPGKTLGFEMDWNNLSTSVKFKDELAPANRIVNQFDLNRNKQSQNSEGLTKTNIIEFIEAEESKLRMAHQEGNISKDFMDLMLLDSKYFWLNQGMLRNTFSPEEASFQVEVSNVLALKSRYYFEFLRTLIIKRKGYSNLMEKYSIISNELSEQVLELFWAYDIREESKGDKHNFELLDAYRAFNQRFPDEVLSTFSRKYLILIENEFYRVNTPITEEMEIVQNSDLSIQDIVDKFKGKVLYFDVWATWCKPCIEEMNSEFKKPLDEFIKDKPIKVIYLSGDVDAVQDKWAKMAKDMRLNSFNIRMTRDKYIDTAEFIGEDPSVGFGIPRYFIIDKNGNLVNADAPRPSDRDKLYKELSKYL